MSILLFASNWFNKMSPKMKIVDDLDFMHEI